MRRNLKLNKISLPPSTKTTVLVLKPLIVKNDMHQLTSVAVESTQHKNLNTLVKLTLTFVHTKTKLETTKNNQKSKFLVFSREEHSRVVIKTLVGVSSLTVQDINSVHLVFSATSKISRPSEN